MRGFLFLTIVLFIWAQDTVQSNEINDEFISEENDDLSIFRGTSEDGLRRNNLRDLNDVQDKISKGILVAWETFKVAAKNANTKINVWVEQEKEKMNKLNNIVVERLDKLKNKIEDVVTKITVAGDKTKECLKEDKNNIETILNTIVSNMNLCLSNNVNKLSNEKDSQVLLELDDSSFLANVRNKISTTCKENDEKCLDDVQNEIITEIEDATQDISNKHPEARNGIKDRPDNVICFIESLTMATKAIVDETVKIVECVRNRG